MLKHFTEDGFSLDTCVERALLNSEFIREQIVLTKTLYCYVELGLIGIRNHNLPEKLKRKSKNHRFRISKKKLGAVLRNVQVKGNPVRDSAAGNATS